VCVCVCVCWVYMLGIQVALDNKWETKTWEYYIIKHI